MRGTIHKRGKNSWRIAISLGRDHNGKRLRKFATVKGTKQDAERQLTELLSAVDKGILITSSKITVGDFLDLWINNYAKLNTSPRTVEGYEGNIRRYLKPVLGHTPLEKLNPQHIHELYVEMREKGLAARTILHNHRILRQALSHAVKWEMIVRNVCDVVDPPRPKRLEMTSLDTQQSQRFLEITKRSKYGVVFYLALHSGMRRSEILGLQWRDLDLQTRTISVRRTLIELKGVGIVEGEPKTVYSRRSISLSSSVAATLSGFRAKQKENREACGLEWRVTDYVFSEDDGSPFRPETISSSFRQIIIQSDLPKIRFHDLRHTHATIMLKAGINPKIVSERLGHASIHITLDTYSHVLPGMQEEAVQRFEEMLHCTPVI